MEVCQAIYEILGPKYLSVPNGNEACWAKTSSKFTLRWNMPNLLGAVDGKRMLLQRPDNSGSHFYDYKGNLILFQYASTCCHICKKKTLQTSIN